MCASTWPGTPRWPARSARCAPCSSAAPSAAGWNAWWAPSWSPSGCGSPLTELLGEPPGLEVLVGRAHEVPVGPGTRLGADLRLLPERRPPTVGGTDTDQAHVVGAGRR